jgi:hypothetical protein
MYNSITSVTMIAVWHTFRLAVDARNAAGDTSSSAWTERHATIRCPPASFDVQPGTSPTSCVVEVGGWKLAID